MSIKFYCTCGKRLKAKDEMAARRAVCPACGNPVGIPSTQPTQRGTLAAPLSPAERQARERQKVGAVVSLTGDLAPPPILPLPKTRERALPLPSQLHPEDFPQQTADVLYQALPRKRTRKWLFWPKETHWHHSLFYPLRLLPLVLGLALMWTLLSGLGLLFWPVIGEQLAEQPYLSLPLAVTLLLLIGYSCGFFYCVLYSALAAETERTRWPGYDLLLKCTWIFILCFLAGPAVLAAIAFYFWLEGGDPTVADRVLLGELILVAIAHMLVSFLAVCGSGRFRDANPIRAVELVHQLGWRARGIILAAALLGALHVFLILDALAFLQPGSGWVPLVAYWVSFFFVSTLLFRWLGLYCHYHEQLGKRV